MSILQLVSATWIKHLGSDVISYPFVPVCIRYLKISYFLNRYRSWGFLSSLDFAVIRRLSIASVQSKFSKRFHLSFSLILNQYFYCCRPLSQHCLTTIKNHRMTLIRLQCALSRAFSSLSLVAVKAIFPPPLWYFSFFWPASLFPTLLFSVHDDLAKPFLQSGPLPAVNLFMF